MRAFDLRGAIIIFAAFFAVFAQTFIVQTHVDFSTADEIALSAHDQAASLAPAQTELRSNPKPADDSAAPCPICQSLATAGVALVASGSVFSAASGLVITAFDVRIPLVSVRPAYSWQSRAPPFHL
ncbi:MAG: hypothetical protein ABUS57_02175 [Pseudomonadota bacterium]